MRYWVRADAFPERACRPAVVSKLAPFEAYLLNRWKEECRSACALMREIIARGYRGGASILRQRLHKWRQVMPEAPRGRTGINSHANCPPPGAATSTVCGAAPCDLPC
jgi:transposase